MIDPRLPLDYPDEDTIRILLTTDNHVGYNENDPITGDDSWKTFHEILTIAKQNNVDMILQSGDLFHINKPTKKSMYQVMKSLRLNCMGNKPCELELLSDPAKIFHYNEFTNVNYEDPNFNISIPFFGISGNHDDATGDSLLSPMDLLHVSGLINHFGKVIESDKIKIIPLLFQKGMTKLALYGLASVRDERLFRTFKEGGVTFEIPTMRQGEWFNLMCLHQNHTGHTNTAFLPEQFLPDFLDLVIWGHEHECIPNLVHNPIKGFDVLQPGSSVATSLCDAEAKPKFVFILEIKNGTQPNLIPVPLTTVRTFKMRTISLKDVPSLKSHDKDAILKYLIEEVEEMIQEANDETKRKMGEDYVQGDDQDEEEEEDIMNQLSSPLIRLRVDYSAPSNGQSTLDYQVENPRRFSNRFVGRVANPNNVVQFFKKKRETKKSTNKNANNQIRLNDKEIENLIHEGNGELEVQTLINDMLNKMTLSLLPELGMNEAIKKFVDKDEKAALKDFIDHEINNEVSFLVTNKEIVEGENPEEIKALMKQVKRANSTNRSESLDVPQSRSNSSARQDELGEHNNDIVMSDIEAATEYNEEDTSTQTKKPKSVSKRVARTTTKRKASLSDSIVVSDDEDENVEEEEEKEKEEEEEEEDDDDIISLDSEAEEVSHSRRKPVARTPRKKNSKTTTKQATKAKTTRTKTRTAVTKTPKTDILGSLLARKRK
ncbi:MRX complex nuclease subunit NDAI_0K00980 [Naumovozyma dairenensis CBS 421]|uniref:Double-strand break repair protein n=1 Tax=Naumovozyma dairenensis (strain ATCC 10597 / BCRC 20456 / CBS 421 / NBRC 0211 / NRRL Y-12639) TaxID=1071378 RepID=G0WHM8_NAUDC|nr:hypothetical protein NDAI_0K00980 [Naumovozyma dairenensis CBS 421]CCD27289.1 hypothetical protein NDAI_0K00980 [Naumovozyma dairenensis CBS 421]